MAATRWRLLWDPPASAAWNMSVDEALLWEVRNQPPTLRLYSWSVPAVSLGYRQENPAWLGRAQELGIQCVRRITGGGAVLHAGDLTYAVVASAEVTDLPNDLSGSYRWVRDSLLSALAGLGLAAEPSRGEAAADRLEVCFTGSTGNEIALGSRKLVGNAQRRTAHGFLQHGSVRLRDDTELYRNLMGISPGPPPALGTLTPENLGRAIVEAFTDRLDAGLQPGTLSDVERELAHTRQLRRSREPLRVPDFS